MTTSPTDQQPCFAPFGSTCPRAVGSKDPLDGEARSVSPPPGAYDPKLPRAYDSGLPRKTVPFATGAPRDCEKPPKDPVPGPGSYNVLRRAQQVLPCRTMGLPQSDQRVVFRSLSAPSIPRDHQCYGYEETGDGRLIRQGPKDLVFLSGRTGDSAGPGHYDSKVDPIVRRPVGGKIAPPPHNGVEKKDDTPGPGYYVAKVEKPPPVYSSFVSTSERVKHEPKVEERPGPGQYDALPRRRPDLRSLYPELQYFGSTSERFKEVKANANVPGPGTYVEGLSRKVPLKPSFGVSDRFRAGASQTGPGPGAYDLSCTELSTASVGTVSILGSTGSLAFGSMESKRGFAAMAEEKGAMPGPGAYYVGCSEAPEDDKRQRRIPKPPSSFFKSDTPKDAIIRSAVKDGQQGPPPGAYSPVHVKDVGAVVRLPKKAEGFLSTMPRSLGDGKAGVAPGPGKYNPGSITGGKKAGSFNRAVLEGTTGLGFESQSRRFVAGKADKMPGPGEYDIAPSWKVRTFNVNFGEVY